MLSFQRRWKNIHFFWRLVLSYSLVVTVILVSQVVLFSRLQWQIEVELRRNGEQLLAHSVEMVDGEISSIRRFASLLSLNSELEDFAYDTEERQAVQQMSLYRLSRRLPDIADSLQAVSRAIVHFVSPDVFVRLGSGSARSGLYYATNLGIPDMTYDQWLASIYNGSFFPGFRDTSEGIMQSEDNEVIYVQFFPVDALHEPLGAILIYIDTSVILRQIDDFLVTGDAGLVITDREGNLIASRQADPEMVRLAQRAAGDASPTDNLQLYHDKLTVLHEISTEYGWIYHAFLPTGVLLQRADQMRSISLIVVVSVMLLMSVIVATLSSRISRPIREIARMIDKPESNRRPDEISQIRGGLSNLIDRNAGLQRDLEQHTQLLRSSFLSQLLLNGFRSSEALNRYLESSRLELGDGGFRVIVAAVSADETEEKYDDSVTQQGARVLSTRSIREVFGEIVQTQNIDSDRIALLLSGQHPFDRATLTKQLTEIATLLSTRYGIHLNVACGEIITDLLDAPQQFRQLTDHLNLSGSGRISMVFVDEVVTPRTIYHYPIETEMQLLTLLKMGDETGAIDILGKILAANELPDGADYSELFRAIVGTYLRCANELFTPAQYHDIRSQVADLERSYDVPAFLERSEAIVSVMCELITNQHESSNTQLRSHITEFLFEHSADPMLNLYAVAKTFDLNEKYLSRFFHDQTGQTFSSYLEKLRMDRAAALLRNSDDTVDVVAGTVGYTNTNTFHKAFRRIFSTTPGRFRQEIQYNETSETL